MQRRIEVVVSPQGETTVQTRGYAGSDCVLVSRFLEEALGVAIAERKTGEFYATEPVQQHQQAELQPRQSLVAPRADSLGMWGFSFSSTIFGGFHASGRTTDRLRPRRLRWHLGADPGA